MNVNAYTNKNTCNTDIEIIDTLQVRIVNEYRYFNERLLFELRYTKMI